MRPGIQLAIRAAVRSWPPGARRQWGELVARYEREGLALGLSPVAARTDAEALAFDATRKAALDAGVYLDSKDALTPETTALDRERFAAARKAVA